MAQAIETGIQRLGYWWCKVILLMRRRGLYTADINVEPCGRYHPVMW